MEATANMKQGRPCNLMEILADRPEFGMTLEELEAVLNPALYTGRCAEQVERLVAELRPVIEGVASGDAEINV